MKTTVRVAAASLLGLAALAPATVAGAGARPIQSITIEKEVVGDGSDGPFSFVLDCGPETNVVDFTLADGESVTFTDQTLGVVFFSEVTCELTEGFPVASAPDAVEAAMETSGGSPVTVTPTEPPEAGTASFEFTTLDDPQLIGYTLTVTNTYEDTPPPSPSSSSSSTSSSSTSTTRASTTTTAAAAAATATPRFTG